MKKTILEQFREEFVEKGADLEHDRWARWQKHFFSKCDYEVENEKVFLTLPKELFERWNRQIDTPYSELSEGEKESDRKETRNYLPLIEHFLTTIKEQMLECVGEEKKLPRKFDCPDCVSLSKELDRDDATCAICNGDRGYNQALKEIRQAIINKFRK